MTTERTKPTLLLRISLCLLILAVGLAGFRVLKKMKKPPREKPVSEQLLPVETMTMTPVDFPVILRGYAEVTSKTRVVMSAEVSGRIIYRNKKLEAGLVVEKDEVLLRIDPDDYRIELATAENMLKILTRDREIARAEFKRLSELYASKKVGSRSTVEKAESALNAVSSQLQQVWQTRDRAALKLRRCEIRAPFRGRVAGVEVEQDEYVTPGRKLFTLVDDSALELIVSLDSRDAYRWLQLEEHREKPSSAHWFAHPKPVRCKVVWSEDVKVAGTAVLERIVRFDPKTRMLSVALALDRADPAAFPLAEGMFCRVSIPGRVLQDVFVVPRRAVSYTGTIYMVVDGRLRPRSVQVIREQGENAILVGGVEAGEKVITTRLENPLTGTRVRIVKGGGQ